MTWPRNLVHIQEVATGSLEVVVVARSVKSYEVAVQQPLKKFSPDWQNSEHIAAGKRCMQEKANHELFAPFLRLFLKHLREQH